MFTRLSYIAGFLIICTLLLLSLYLQFYQGLEPCPLCALQRVSFGLLGIWFLVGIIFVAKRSMRIIVNSLLFLTSLLGLSFAGRQIWLQNFPPANSGECGVSIQYMIKMMPFNQVLQKVFEGSAECSEKGWEFLHLNMAEWAFTWFILFSVLSFCLLLEEIHWHPKK